MFKLIELIVKEEYQREHSQSQVDRSVQWRVIRKLTGTGDESQVKAQIRSGVQEMVGRFNRETYKKGLGDREHDASGLDVLNLGKRSGGLWVRAEQVRKNKTDEGKPGKTDRQTERKEVNRAA